MPTSKSDTILSNFQPSVHPFFVFVLVDADMKNLIHEKKSEQELQAFAFKKSDSIHEMGADLIKTGMTSVNELIRLNNQAEDAGI